MRVFVAGASGAVGRPLVERLVRAGHRVTGVVRSADEAQRLVGFGAEPVEVDVFEPHAVEAALALARPDAVVDELTHLPASPADLDAALPADTRLRLEGGGNLFAAAEGLGVGRYIQQSCGFYLAARGGLADEAAPLRVDAPGGVGVSATMYAELERRVLGSPRIRGTALRYGFFCGPGTWYWTEGAVAGQARAGEAPILGEGAAVWSFVHVEEAAAATVAALDAEPGIYNVVDDDPLPVGTWLPAFARWVGAPAPARVGAGDALARAGEEAVYLHDRLSGASNAKAREVLGFRPRPLAWMQGRARNATSPSP